MFCRVEYICFFREGYVLFCCMEGGRSVVRGVGVLGRIRRRYVWTDIGRIESGRDGDRGGSG